MKRPADGKTYSVRATSGIPVPMTVEESIASMKASLLKKSNARPTFYRVDCGGCNGCEIEDLRHAVTAV